MPRFYSAITVSLLYCLFLLPTASAQDTASEGWPVEQHCIEVQSPPPDWHYDGTIFMLGTTDSNVRGMRDDLDTTYIVAFGNSNYTESGAISPDGRWFAVPSGYAGDYVSNMMMERYYYVDKLRVYGTGLAQERYEFPWEMSRYRGSSEITVPSIVWVDNERLLYGGYDGWGSGGSVPSIINPFTENVREFGSNDSDQYTYFSPDTTRIFTDAFESISLNLQDVDTSEILANLPNVNQVVWKPDSSEFAASISLGEGQETKLVLFDRDGNQLDTITSRGTLVSNQTSWSHDGNYLFYLVYDYNSSDAPSRSDNYAIYVADIQQQKVINTCLRTGWFIGATWHGNANLFSSGIWSEQHSNFIATIVDLDKNEAYDLGFEVLKVLGWRPEDE